MRWVDGWLIAMVAAAAAALLACAWLVAYHPELFRHAPHGSLWLVVFHYTPIVAPTVGGGSALALTIRRHWWWAVLGALLALFALGLLVLGSMWLGGGFRT